MSKRKSPYWQHEPCPPWCWTTHKKHDGGSDRDCLSKWSKTVTMSLLEPRRLKFGPGERVYHNKPSVEVYLKQQHREAEPRVQMSTETEHGITRLELTPAEALRLIKALTTAVDVAEGHASGTS